MQDHRNLSIFCYTWNRDSHGLYDYENINANTNQLEISKSKTLLRGKNDIKVVLNEYQFDKDDEEIARIEKNNNSFILKNSLEFDLLPTEFNINSLQNKFWLPVKSECCVTSTSSINENRSFNYFPKLKFNDIIKLGRVKYVITEMHLEKDENSMDIDMNETSKQVIQLVTKVKMNKQQNIDCKICLSNTEDENNIMVNLCNCTGSIAIAHVNCIKQWMATKLSKKSNEKGTVFSYNIKSFNCEICKMPYPLKFELNNQYHCLIDINIPSGDYIILESLNQTKDNCNYKSIHVVKVIKGEKILLGRGHQCDIRINDISVSRKHASLDFINSGVVLKDLFSKFGTLVLQNNDFVANETPFYLQIGRTLIKFSLMKSCKNIFEIKRNDGNIPENGTSKSDVFIIDKNFDNNLQLNINKPKLLFKVEKMENKNYKNSIDKYL